VVGEDGPRMPSHFPSAMEMTARRGVQRYLKDRQLDLQC